MDKRRDRAVVGEVLEEEYKGANMSLLGIFYAWIHRSLPKSNNAGIVLGLSDHISTALVLGNGL